jgi:hypothetical protein
MQPALHARTAVRREREQVTVLAIGRPHDLGGGAADCDGRSRGDPGVVQLAHDPVEVAVRRASLAFDPTVERRLADGAEGLGDVRDVQQRDLRAEPPSEETRHREDALREGRAVEADHYAAQTHGNPFDVALNLRCRVAR